MDNVDRLRSLFRGAENYYGGCVPDPKVTSLNGKTKVKQWKIDEKVTRELWEDHVNGRNAIGIYPIFGQDKCVWGCIDVDVYPAPVEQVLKIIREKHYPLYPCYSKSKGLHIFLFVKEPVLAGQMQLWLGAYANRLQLGHPEVFPKQPKTDAYGNFVNMPFFGDTRLAIGSNGKILRLEDFNPKLAEPDKIEKSLAVLNSPLGLNAPPCLQQLVESGAIKDGRNRILYAAAIFYKKRCADDTSIGLENELHKFNNLYCIPPKPEKFINDLYARVTKKEYRYQCQDPVFRDVCNPTECKKRKYGIMDGDGTPIVTHARKLHEDEEDGTYTWELHFYGEKGPLFVPSEHFPDHKKFRARFYNAYNHTFSLMKPPEWEKYLNDVGKIVEEVPVDPGRRISDKVRIVLKKYADDYPVTDKHKLENNKRGAWIDTRNHLHVPKTDFCNYLEIHKISLSSHKMKTVLREISGLEKVDVIMPVRNTSVQLYRVPMSCLEDLAPSDYKEDHDEGEPL